VEALGLEFDDSPSKKPANVAAFVLKAPALDRLLLVHSRKEGRAWELPGGAVEPGEHLWAALVREVTEESGAHLLDLERKTIPLDGCEVFQGTSETERLTPGDDADEARWVTRTEASLLTLSDLPSARLIREWLDK
jgi:8-oxo-dGTP pyrophosphatase MutT (NUDIX family)